MTAVPQILPTAAMAFVHSRSQVLQWTEQGFVFELSTEDSRLLETARTVFGADAPAPGVVPSRRWTIERTNTGSEAWTISASSELSSMIPQKAGTRDDAILHVEYDAIDWLLHNSPDAVTVHAALLTKNGKGVMIAGPSLAGKSTLATSLWRSGWTLMCDDIVLVDTVGQTASPTPRRVSLRFASKELVGESAWNEISRTRSCVETSKGLFFHPHEMTGKPRVKITPLSAIFFLARLDATAAAAEARKLNPAKAALSLLPYAFNARTLPFVEGLRRITPLLDKVPAYDLGRGDLQSMIETVESTVG